MAEKGFQATLSREHGRSSWCVIFRHPIRAFDDGRPHRRIRRGLGTSDEAEAQKLVDQLNDLLANKSLWTPGARDEAQRLYHKRIVDAFYDELTPAIRNSLDTRERVIPLPGPQEGYARVLFLGTTGAGKTTVARQLIGTDPEKERFPSISPAKTTIADHEIILASVPFRAVVSFISRDQVRLNIEECVSAAILTLLDKGTTEEAVRRFLVHPEQRFRLSYLLGTSTPILEKEDLTDDDVLEDEIPNESDLPSEERVRLAGRLQEYIETVELISRDARVARDRIAATLGIVLENATSQDRDTVDELLEDEIRGDEPFNGLVDQIFDDVESRFKLLEAGTLHFDRAGWPSHWVFETEDRQEFVRRINAFSSNSAHQYGRLLTPLVDGIRVAGPFRPKWSPESDPRLVLLDGEGLGHTPDSASSLSTETTKRFDLADSILLVDNAAQPMQAAPAAVLKSLVTSGHEHKLVLCFTHFDDLAGAANLQNAAAKKNHVMSSVDNVVVTIGKAFGRSAESSLKRLIPKRTFFLARIQHTLSESARFTRSEFENMVKALSLKPPVLVPSTATPVYDDANLILSVQKAMQEFRDPWKARLGLPSRTGVTREHWTRIKALTRRLGVLGSDEYDTLKPVADLITRLTEHISLFLDTPLKWEEGNDIPDEARRAAIAAVERHVFSRLHPFAGSRLFLERVKDWNGAYSHRGTGSTLDRATDIDGIYETAAPVPGETAVQHAHVFLTAVRTLVKHAIKEGGGKLQGLE